MVGFWGQRKSLLPGIFFENQGLQPAIIITGYGGNRKF